MADAEGFQVVKKRKGHRNRNCRENNRSSSKSWNRNTCSETNLFDVNELKTKIHKCREEISTSEFFSSFREMFHNGRFVENSSSLVGSESKTTASILKDPITDVVCYGIGKISSCPIARYQFALLLLLKELLQIIGLCFIFEPHFSEDEKLVAKELGCSLIQHNEEGKRKVEHLTLFFMLHCGKPLYNSVLWANWGPGLSNVIILGNKFSSYLERIPSRQLKEEAPYIYNILPYTTETPIKNTFHHSDIFNDSAIHCFPVELLTKVPHLVWEDSEEPKYNPNDPEIITQSLVS